MTLAEHVRNRFGDEYLGQPSIPVEGPVDGNMSIERAYLGLSPNKPFFGQILAVLRYDGRYFMLRYHVWSPHQKPAMANRMAELDEFIVKNVRNYEYLEKTETPFANMAFWMHTPDAALDGESLSLRAVAKKLKTYSVRNRLCRSFGKIYRGGI